MSNEMTYFVKNVTTGGVGRRPSRKDGSGFTFEEAQTNANDANVKAEKFGLEARYAVAPMSEFPAA